MPAKLLLKIKALLEDSDAAAPHVVQLPDSCFPNLQTKKILECLSVMLEAAASEERPRQLSVLGKEGVFGQSRLEQGLGICFPMDAKAVPGMLSGPGLSIL